MRIKRVLSGEGADKIFVGYLHLRKCPDSPKFQDEREDTLARRARGDDDRVRPRRRRRGTAERDPCFLEKMADRSRSTTRSRRRRKRLPE